MEEKLPAGWVWTTLDDIVTPERVLERPVKNSTLQFVGLEHVESETMRLIGTISAQELKSTALHFWPGDVLYGRLRPYLNKVLQPDFEGLCSAEFLIFRKLVNLSSSYLQYFLNSWNFKEFASHQITGDRPRADWDLLKVFKFPLPPLPEQHRIVAAIEQQFTRLDSAVASLQSARAKAKQYRASLLKSAVEGELTKAWRKEHPASETGAQLLARILKERRTRWEEEELAKMDHTPKDDTWKEKYKEPQGPDVEKLPELPEGWRYTSIFSLLSTSRKGMVTGPFGSLLKKHEHRTEGIPVFGIENIAAMRFVAGNKIYITQDKASELSQYDALPDDILISRSGTVGEVCVVPKNLGEARISTNLMRVSLAKDGLLPQFFCLLFNGSPFVLDQVSELCKGSTRDFLSQAILTQIIFPLPPLTEQEQIVAEVEAKLSNMEQLEATIGADLKRAEQERQSILQEAFAGRLVPQDPNDEPASVLLERIREARKQREAVEKSSREGRKVVIAQQRKKRKHVAPLYDVLVEAGGELAPEELYQRSDNQRKSLSEEERGEGFYIELGAEVTASLIEEDRPTTDKIVLYALEQDNDELEAEEELAFPLTEMRQAREWDEQNPIIPEEPEMREAREEPVWSQPNLDTHLQGKKRQAKEDVHKPSLWDA